MSTEFPPSTVVTYAEVTEFDDVTTGTVIDHTPGGLVPPRPGTVLVRWGRSLLSWEYTNDLKRVDNA